MSSLRLRSITQCIFLKHISCDFSNVESHYIHMYVNVKYNRNDKCSLTRTQISLQPLQATRSR